MNKRINKSNQLQENPAENKDQEASLAFADFYRGTFEQAATGMMNAHLDGTVFEVNDTLCAMLGYSKEELLTMSVQDLTPEDEWTKDLESYRSLRAGQINALSLEKRYMRKDGTPIWVQLSISILRNSKGEALYYIGIIQDIDAKKEAELSVQSEYAKLETEAYRRARHIQRINEELQHERIRRQQSDDEISLFFNTSLDMLCIGNFDGYFTRLSPTWTKVLGWNTDELCSKPFLEFVHPEDLEDTLELMERLKPGTEVILFVNRYLCKDGTYRWIEWNSYAFPERQLIIGAARDITEKKKTETVLQEAKHQLEEANWKLLERNDELQILYSISQSLFEDLDFEQRLEHLQESLLKHLKADALFIHSYDAHSGYLTLETESGSSPELKQLTARLRPNEGLAALSIQRKEVLMTTVDHHPDPKLSRVIEAMGVKRLVSIPLIAGVNVIGTVTLLYRDNKTFSPREKRLYQAIGNQLAVALNNSKLYSEIQDELKARRKLETLQTETLKDLEKERAFLTHMMEIIPISIIILDKAGIITFANAASECTLDTPVDHLENNTYLKADWQYFRLDGSPLPFSEQPFECVESTKKPLFDHIQVIVNAKGDRRVLSFNGTPLLDKSGDLEWAIFSIQDITSRVQYEEDLKASRDAAEEANKAKSEFLANMSHEIRTPLNAVIGFSEILKKAELPQALANHVDAINIAGKSLLTLINDILDLSKIESGVIEVQLNPLSPARLLSEIEQIFRQSIAAKGLEFIIQIAPEVPKWLLLDELRLRQILLNLVGNAVKFTHQGHIVMSLRLSEASKPVHSSNRFSLVLSVSDTGIGIAEHDFERIFESFRQQSGQTNRTYEGTGLGLTISRKLVEMMNGKIAVESSLGAGSTFSVYLHDVEAIHNTDTTPLHPAADLPETNFAGSVILIVDDVELNLALTREVLENLGIRVLKAYNGEQAIVEATAERPDLILMDIRMPVMDGIEATKRIKSDSKTRHIPIVALTASVTEWTKDEIRTMGFDGFLLKPLVTQHLYQILEQHLSPHREAQPTPPAKSTLDPLQSSESIPRHMDSERLLELHETLKDTVAKLKGAIKLSTVKQLAELLLTCAERYNSKSLEEIGARLKTEISLWDIEGIRNTIAEIQSFLDEILPEEARL